MRVVVVVFVHKNKKTNHVGLAVVVICGEAE